jgi:hypothetical protein
MKNPVFLNCSKSEKEFAAAHLDYRDESYHGAISQCQPGKTGLDLFAVASSTQSPLIALF